MANRDSFKQVARARIRTLNILMKEEDWEGAAYIMGHVLECALKALICRTLRLESYPTEKDQPKIAALFLNHEFQALLKISGMENVFSDRGPKAIWQNWSDFTIEFPGNWTLMRYEPNKAPRNWDDLKVKGLYTNLMGKPNGIVTQIKRRW